MMKYFLQFEGNEKLLIKCMFVMQILIFLLLITVAFRPIDLYIDDDQLKELYPWRIKQDSKDVASEEKPAELSD